MANGKMGDVDGQWAGKMVKSCGTDARYGEKGLKGVKVRRGRDVRWSMGVVPSRGLAHEGKGLTEVNQGNEGSQMDICLPGLPGMDEVA